MLKHVPIRSDIDGQEGTSMQHTVGKDAEVGVVVFDLEETQSLLYDLCVQLPWSCSIS